MEVVGNQNFITCFCEKLSTCGASLVIGYGQSGKTSICNHVFQLKDLQVCKIPVDFYNTKDMVKYLEPHRDALTISSFFCSKQKVIFLDDFDNIAVDRSMISYINNFVNHPNFKRSNLRLVVTINANNEKQFGELKKRFDVFRIHNPTIQEAFDFLAQKNGSIDPESLLDICKEYNGNVGGILTRLSFIEQADATVVKMKDKTPSDVIHELFSGMVTPSQSDILMTYDPHIISMMYFDNMCKHLSHTSGANSCKTRYAISKDLADFHVMDELGFRTQNIEIVNELLSYYLSSRPPLCSIGDKSSYEFTKIMTRASNRYILSKKVHKKMSVLGVDQDCREVLFDFAADLVLTKGKKAIDEDMYSICREYMQTIGEIKKEYLDKFDATFFL